MNIKRTKWYTYFTDEGVGQEFNSKSSAMCCFDILSAQNEGYKVWRTGSHSYIIKGSVLIDDEYVLEVEHHE